MALTVAFKLAGVGPDTEVISTPLTCVAGNEPIRMLGGRPVWADVDRSTGMVTAETIEPEAALTAAYEDAYQRYRRLYPAIRAAY